VVLLERGRPDPQIEEVAHQHDSAGAVGKVANVPQKRMQLGIIPIEVNVPDEDEIATGRQERTP